MEAKEIVYRYQKDTIKARHWEIRLSNLNGFWTLWSAHVVDSTGEAKKENECIISNSEALAYIYKNKGWLIEKYERTVKR